MQASSRATALLSLSAAVVTAVGVGVLVTDSDAAPEPRPSPSASPAPVDASAVNDAFQALAEARGPAASAVDTELRAGVRVGPLFAGLRSPSSVDATLDDVEPAVTLFARSDPAEVASALDQLGMAMDQADEAVVAAQEVAADASWEAEFLAAQSEVVRALREWNEASRAVHAVAVDSWELWQEVVEAAAVFDENRYRYRTEEEAAATWEIEQGDRTEEVMAADAALTSAAEVRDGAAQAVVEADERATEVFARRPSS